MEKFDITALFDEWNNALHLPLFCCAACQTVTGDAREIGERAGIRLDTASKLCQSFFESS